MGGANSSNYIPRSNSNPGGGGNSAPRGKGNGSIFPSGSRSNRGSRNGGKQKRKPSSRRPKGSRTTNPTPQTKTLSKGAGGAAVVSTAKGTGLKILGKGILPYFGGAALAVLDLFLFPDPVNDYDIEDWVANPGERQVVDELELPWTGGQNPNTTYSMKYGINPQFVEGEYVWQTFYKSQPSGLIPPFTDVGIYQLFGGEYLAESEYIGDRQRYSVLVTDATGEAKFWLTTSSWGIKIFGFVPVDGSTEDNPDTIPVESQATIDNSRVSQPQKATADNLPPSGIRPVFPSNRTSSPNESDYYSYPSQEPPVVKQATTKTPNAVVTDSEQPKIESPSETPQPLPIPESPVETTIEETEQQQSDTDSTNDTESNIISKTKVRRADGTIETTTQREATPEEMEEFNKNLRDANRKLENAQEVLEEDRKRREITIDHPELEAETEFDKFAKEWRQEQDEVRRSPFGEINQNIPPSKTKNDDSRTPPPEPDSEPEVAPFVPPPPVVQNKTSECKGCNKKILDRLNGLNTGLQGVDLLLVREIHSTVHSSTHGLAKIQSFAETAWKATGANKIVNTISAVASLHNAAMLSQNAAQSIGDVATNTLSLFNIKGFDGEPIDVNDAVGGAIKDKLVTVFSEANLNAASAAWLKLNRIHQAVSSTVCAIQGTKNALLEADEVTGGHVAKIGNALQSQGIIEDETYDWMNPEPDYQQPFNGILGKISAVEDTVDRVSQVVNTGLEIRDNSTELVTSSQELIDATTDFVTTRNQEELTAIGESQSPVIDRLDTLKYEPAEDE